MAILAGLSLAYAVTFSVGFLGLLLRVLRLMRRIRGAVRDVDVTRRSIAAHTAPLRSAGTAVERAG